MAEVYYNSKFVGTAEDPHSFVSRVKEERRAGAVTDNLNVYYNDKSNGVYVETSKGRARRPLIIVRDGIPLLTERHIKQLEKNEISWSDLVKEGVIEYLDAAEEENTYVAFFEKELTPEQLESIGDVDILLIPVGGVYTINGKEAQKVISQLEPKIVIPMHYNIPGLKFKSGKKIDGLNAFCKEIGICPTEEINKFKVTKKDLPQEEMKIVVLQP